MPHLCEKILGAVPVFAVLGQPMCCKMGPSLMYATCSQHLLLTAPPVPWGMPGLKVQYLLEIHGVKFLLLSPDDIGCLFTL